MRLSRDDLTKEFSDNALVIGKTLVEYKLLLSEESNKFHNRSTKPFIFEKRLGANIKKLGWLIKGELVYDPKEVYDFVEADHLPFDYIFGISTVSQKIWPDPKGIIISNQQKLRVKDIPPNYFDYLWVPCHKDLTNCLVSLNDVRAHLKQGAGKITLSIPHNIGKIIPFNHRWKNVVLDPNKHYAQCFDKYIDSLVAPIDIDILDELVYTK